MIGLEGNDPSSGKHFSVPFIPATGPLTRRIASGTTERQGHRQVCRTRRGGPRTLSRTTDANLDCAFVETALVFVVPKIGKPRPPSFQTTLPLKKGIYEHT